MKKVEIKIQFEKEKYRIPGDPESQIGPNWAKVIFENVLGQIINSTNPQGLSAGEARAFARVLDAVDLASDGKISLSVIDAQFLYDRFFDKAAKILPAQSVVFCLYANEISRALGVSE